MPILLRVFDRYFKDEQTVSNDIVRRDQLEAVRNSILQALPVNVLLGLASWAVAVHAGESEAGALWFTAATLVNVARASLCLAPCAALADTSTGDRVRSSLALHLRLGCLGALASGLVWALLPMLCRGYTTPQTLFYLAVTCGITAGSATYGTAYARIPICFMFPPLLSVAGCLIVAGGFDRLCLSLTVLLYLAALVRGTLAAQRVFREASRSKNEARAAAAICEEARAQASALALQMEQRAMHDALTGLLNRAGFLAKVQEAAARGLVSPCLMLLDLDGFKSVNDVYGHKAGDQVLIEVARRIRAMLADDHIVGRLGGDEFAIFFDAADRLDSPAATADKLLGVMAAPLQAFDVGHIGMSIGVYVAHHLDLVRMMGCADEALYAAKKGGRNRFHLFDEASRRRLDMLSDVKRDLAGALVNRDIEVWLQPVFAGGGRTLSGFEALVRWRHPAHGRIPPADLIALASQTGLTKTLFLSILDQVCAALRTIRDAGRPDLRVSMNVSPRELIKLPIDEIVVAALHAHDLRPSALEIEITEEITSDLALRRARVLNLASAGIQIALDDFGAGSSSLASIHDMRVQRLKIDRSLVQGVSIDDDRRRLVEGILGLGRSLQLEVVAQGVETLSDLAVLRTAGCQLMQGFLLGPPMQLVEAKQMLTSPSAKVA